MTMRTHPRLVRSLAVGGVIFGVVAGGLALPGRVQAQPAPRADQPSTLFFSDRPERITGQLRTSDFVGHWTKGADNFA